MTKKNITIKIQIKKLGKKSTNFHGRKTRSRFAYTASIPKDPT